MTAPQRVDLDAMQTRIDGLRAEGVITTSITVETLQALVIDARLGQLHDRSRGKRNRDAVRARKPKRVTGPLTVDTLDENDNPE